MSCSSNCGCNQGKPYTRFSDNPKMDTTGRWEQAKPYKSGGVVYSDKNDPDTYTDMDDYDEDM